ncbi:amylo-alpha-1,6-glucosidase [Alkaliphilus peptidifermentans]|uniref:Trehalase n=1 Tax=Alkaliphilus peptidifermentans DSM 18978 TaxID=1120976 RepID=A0A1G5L5U6_9FIRM|nr:trehalase family glycosidase [Alkaliphilus peptidifermentans]SCZ08186.1 Trehalase [Alkaliphilus peptidifermentans DSM 18978]
MIDREIVDLKTIPFSRFGTFFVISLYEEAEEKALYLRDIRGGDASLGKQFRIEFLEPINNQEGSLEWKLINIDDLKIKGTEISLEVTRKCNKNKVSDGIEDNQQHMYFCFEDEDTLRIEGVNMAIRMKYLHKKYDNIYEIKKDNWELCSYSKELRFGIWRLQGELNVDAPWESIGNTKIEITAFGKKEEPFDIAIESYKVIAKSRNSFPPLKDIMEKNKKEYDDWYKKIGDVPAYYEKGKHYASYLTWTNFVKPEGLLKYPAMYMTKNWMTNVWSWDNCFGAIFLAHSHPELAYGQFMMFSNNQHESGAYPDYINDTYASYSSAKPPIYGWTYDYLMKLNSYFSKPSRLMEVYETVAKQTSFWLDNRQSYMGLPYYAHGNDSGWDNGTIFALGIPVVAPDLAAFLIYQTDFLSRVALKLNMKKEAEGWLCKSQSLLNNLENTLWRGDRFAAYNLSLKKWVDTGDSLQLFLPVILGKRLKPSIREKLIDGLKDENRFNAPFGLATEALSSDLIKYNGYWRGPVWAPVMLIFIESLKRQGEDSFANELTKKFLEAPLSNGMAENFDPITGEGLVDPAFAWTSAVFMILLTDKNDI